MGYCLEWLQVPSPMLTVSYGGSHTSKHERQREQKRWQLEWAVGAGCYPVGMSLLAWNVCAGGVPAAVKIIRYFWFFNVSPVKKWEQGTGGISRSSKKPTLPLCFCSLVRVLPPKLSA